jgi:hypothetical protein
VKVALARVLFDPPNIVQRHVDFGNLATGLPPLGAANAQRLRVASGRQHVQAILP